MFVYSSFFAVSLFATLFHFGGANLVTVHQDEGKNAHIEVVELEHGTVLLNSSLSFVFSWPYVQMCTDKTSGASYLTTFPDGNAYPVLYLLDDQLQITYAWLNTPFTFWDMQYSAEQSTVYGILVTEDMNGGMYGRTLSNYSLDMETDTISPTELYTLPYMWYVNASSFHTVASTYFALINNFPGKSNSTLDQKLVIADFSIDKSVAEPDVLLLDIDSGDVMMQFIAYSATQGLLYFAGPSKLAGTTEITVGVLCTVHGKIHETKFQSSDVVSVGPLVADDDQGRLLFYVKSAKSANNVWTLLSLGYAEGSEAIEVGQYEGDLYRSFVAAGYTSN